MGAPDLAAPGIYAECVAPRRAARHGISREAYRTAFAICEISLDFAVSTAGFLFAHAMGARLFAGAALHSSMRGSAATAIVVGLLIVVLMQREGAYRGGSGLLRIRETERAIRIPVQSLALRYAIGLLMGSRFYPSDFFIAAVLIPALVAAGRQLRFLIAGRIQAGVSGPRRAVIYGAGETARSVFSALLDAPRLGLQPAALIGAVAGRFSVSLAALGYRNRSSMPILRGPMTAGRLQALQCDLLLIADHNLSGEERDAAIVAGRQAGCEVALVLGPPAWHRGNESVDIDGLRIASVTRRSTPWHDAAIKRTTDVLLSLALLTAIAPLLLVIAVLVCLDSPGPPLFVQKRVGQNGRLFHILKFRTMVAGASKYSLSPRSSCDPRITRIGRVLRRLNLDELPQLLNVLAGTMSLVGPRPEMPFITETYDAHSRQRLEVIPGLTGLWQLSADRSAPIHENLEYDLYYIRNRGFFLDLAILAHTLMFAMTGGI